MRSATPQHPRSLRALLASTAPLALIVLLTLAGCSSSASTSTTATSGPSATTTPAPAQTLAWSTSSPTGFADVWASIEGGAAHQITHDDGADPCSTNLFGAPVFSPDHAHIAVVGGIGCGDGQNHGIAYVITVATGALTPIPGSNALTDTRSIGWLDNTTIWLAEGTIDTYTLGAASVTHLPDTDGAIDAVVRSDVIYYLVASYSHTSGANTGTLHRYSLSSHTVLQPAIPLGGFDTVTDSSPGNFSFQGWDVSPDGTHIVYQTTTPAPVTVTNYAGVGSSQVHYATADGNSPSQILQYMTTTTMIRIRFSPDGSQVAVTEAEPRPDVITGCVASPGTRTDPCFHAYTIADDILSSGYPIWSPDGHSFLVTAGGSGPSGIALYRLTVGSPSAVLFQSNAYNPWAS